MALTQDEIERYARHLVLHEVGGPGQNKLKDAKVLVVGAGGLGAPLLYYLAAAGFGTIGIIILCLRSTGISYINGRIKFIHILVFKVISVIVFASFFPFLLLPTLALSSIIIVIIAIQISQPYPPSI